jgi:hypothetical protein
VGSTWGLGKRLSMWLSDDMVGGATSAAEVGGRLVEEASVVRSGGRRCREGLQ